MKTAFETYLEQQTEEAWAAALATLLRSVHEVDRNATKIWFAFYPLSLHRALQETDDREKLARELLLQGEYELKTQIDSSHHFLYGHRFWPQVKRAVEQHAEGVGSGVLGVDNPTQKPSGNAASIEERDSAWSLHPTPKTQHPTSSKLADQIVAVARTVAGELKKDESLLIGITAVAFMTVRQVGLEAFKAAPGTLAIDKKHVKQSPEHILHERAKDDSQGWLGFLKTVDKQWTVTWDENDNGAKYKLREAQDLAWGAAEDQSRDWSAIDPRRI
ncbi:MAG TPA: hypothetical protein VGW32_09465, partial [Pyrinomonadaceae bacterium]|nr:hypothetical protein [Pyrinomonadaceae bacterium]